VSSLGESAESGGPSNLRAIFHSEFSRQQDELVYEVAGSGFLHHMVRNLVGTFLLAGKGTLPPKDIPAILAARNRSANPAATAPASGLYLVEVQY
jgi:tRNA pseudouridine38-40 synthase